MILRKLRARLRLFIRRRAWITVPIRGLRIKRRKKPRDKYTLILNSIVRNKSKKETFTRRNSLAPKTRKIVKLVSVWSKTQRIKPRAFKKSLWIRDRRSRLREEGKITSLCQIQWRYRTYSKKSIFLLSLINTTSILQRNNSAWI